MLALSLFCKYATAITTAILAIITLFLAGVGLYGILSYSTQMRRFELGTRMAIGAKRASIVTVVNGLIGAGIFGLPEALHSAVGPFAPWLLLIGGILVMAILICFAELTMLTDRSGGPQRYVGDAFGAYPGFVVSVLANLTAGHTSASRMPPSLADDGLLPAWFGKVSRWGTPANSIIFYGVGAIMFAL